MPDAPESPTAHPAPPVQLGMRPRPAVGWREWVTLPDLPLAAGRDDREVPDPPRVKAKVDTGARTSSLHAFDVETFERDGGEYVRFRLHPRQKSRRGAVDCEAELLDTRAVKSSNGQVQARPVIVTHAVVCGKRFPLEVTLANRDAMGFRMLLGREALRGRFLVDPAASYLGGKPPRREKTEAKKAKRP